MSTCTIFTYACIHFYGRQLGVWHLKHALLRSFWLLCSTWAEVWSLAFWCIFPVSIEVKSSCTRFCEIELLKRNIPPCSCQMAQSTPNAKQIVFVEISEKSSTARAWPHISSRWQIYPLYIFCDGVSFQHNTPKVRPMRIDGRSQTKMS